MVGNHIHHKSCVNTLRPRQNGREFPDDIFKCIFLNENIWISIEISLKFVPKGPINNIPSLVQILACRRSGDKSLSELMMASLLTHVCITRPQWVESPTQLSGKMLTCQCTLCYIRYMAYYSETTWAVGIAQLTHHEVQGGGKNPETAGRGILPPPRTERWVNCAIPIAHVVLLLSHTLFG